MLTLWAVNRVASKHDTVGLHAGPGPGTLVHVHAIYTRVGRTLGSTRPSAPPGSAR
jgi:hypothetical protein